MPDEAGHTMVRALRATMHPRLVELVSDSDLHAQAHEILEGDRELLLAAREGLVTKREATSVLLDRMHTWLIDLAGEDWVDWIDPGEDLIRVLQDAVFERET